MDGGIEIFNYLNTLGSDCSSASEWSVNSNDSDRMLEQYRSFEDVPASQFKVISRRASLVTKDEGKNLALHVLKSYKGVEMEKGGLSPQVKKLQKTFSFKSFFDEVKESENNFIEEEIKDDGSVLGMGASLVRSVSYESRIVSSKERNEGSGNLLRQRRMGTVHNLWYEEAQRRTLRKKILKRCTSHIQFKCSERLAQSIDDVRCGSVENVANLKSIPFIRFNDRYKDNDRTSTFNIRKHNSDVNLLVVPTIVVTDTDSLAKDDKNLDLDNTLTDVHLDKTLKGVVKDVYVDTSDVAEESICDCRICREDEEDYSKSFLRRKLSKLFMKIVSLIEFGKKLTYWDENNNINEGEMYNCIMHVLKLMFGLWLRHLDHNPRVVST